MKEGDRSVAIDSITKYSPGCILRLPLLVRCGVVRLLRIGRPATTVGIHRIMILSLPNFNRLLLGYLRPAYGIGAPAEKEDPDKSKEGKIRRDGRVEGTLHGYRVCWHDSS